MRVCIVAPSLDILGGQSVQALRLLQHLESLPELEVSLLPVNPRLPGPLRRLQRIKYVRTIVTSIAYVGSLLRNVPRYDVLHVFSASYFSFLLAPLPAILVGRMFGKRVLLNYHSGAAEDHLTRWKRSAVPAMRLADEIIVPTPFLVRVFARFGLAARSVPNFVEVERLPHRVRRPLRPLFLVNRNFEPAYNVAGAIRAFQLVQREFPDARLTVAGFGPERANLERQVSELGARNVTFAGRVEPEAMAALYDAADVYLNASRVDAMPLSILDAFAAGLPVVTTNAGGIPDLVHNGVTGIVVPCDDDAALARGAMTLLRDPDRAYRIAARARSECEERYVWPVVAAEWIDAYRGGRGDQVESDAAVRGPVAAEAVR